MSAAATQVQPVRERQIRLRDWEVRALLDGRKTQTRRIMKPQPPIGANASSEFAALGVVAGRSLSQDACAAWRDGADVRNPYGVPGDRLWVREAFSGDWILRGLPPSRWPTDAPLHYWADGNPGHGDWTPPKPSIHMPRWASRITLEIVSVRVERVQDISEEDARAEGFESDEAHWWTGWDPRVEGYPEVCLNPGDPPPDWMENPRLRIERTSARESFKRLWNSIHKDRSERWLEGAQERSPWVWVYEFRRVGS